MCSLAQGLVFDAVFWSNVLWPENTIKTPFKVHAHEELVKPNA
jgi:hypothetical protein